MAEAASAPCTSVAAPALRESPEGLARRLADDLLESRQRILRGMGIGVGLGLTLSVVAWSLVGVGGLPVMPVVVFAAGLGLSTSMLALALTSTIFDHLVARRFRRLMRVHGLDDAVGRRALEDARRAIAEGEQPLPRSAAAVVRP
jgi:hypothetical protein